MIQRRKPLLRSSKPMPIIAKRKMVERRHYAVRAKAYKEAHPECEVKLSPDCTGTTQDVHHVFGRGKYLLISSTWLAVCRPCHTYIHSHPSEARTLNLLK